MFDAAVEVDNTQQLIDLKEQVVNLCTGLRGIVKFEKVDESLDESSESKDD